ARVDAAELLGANQGALMLQFQAVALLGRATEQVRSLGGHRKVGAGAVARLEGRFAQELVGFLWRLCVLSLEARGTTVEQHLGEAQEEQHKRVEEDHRESPQGGGSGEGS